MEVDENNFELEVIQSEQPVLVNFSADWSRPCKILGAVLQEIATECGQNLKVVRVNADDNPTLSMWYEIQSIPTLLFFKDGSVHARIVGTATKSAILTRIQRTLRAEE